ncbi:MAG: CHAT domain-containing protein [Sphingomonadales bacterium]|jgi:hypothetical protein
MVTGAPASPLPAIFLAFANDEDAHLPLLKRERASISALLQKMENRGAIQLAEDPAASIDGLFDQLTALGPRLAILHYGGHANGGGLLLENTPQAGAAGNQFAHAQGLAGMLGQLGGVQLVVLNGCATRGQVEGLITAGVPAVIATSVPVQDEAATAFAEQFWLQLARGEPIGTAFNTASDYLVTKYGPEKQVQTFRGISWAGKPDTDAASDGVTGVWGLYLGGQGDAALDYALPPIEPPPPPPDVVARGSVNARLKQQLRDALVAVGGTAASAITSAEEQDDDTGRLTAFAIINAFPLPVGEQLRALFAAQTADRQRLEQIVRTYVTTMQLFSYAALVQLWDERSRHPDMAIDPQRRAALDSFLALNQSSAATFDYYALMVATLGILNDNSIEPFIKQSARILTDLTDDRSTAAHAALEALRRGLRDDTIADADLAALDQASSDHLAELLGDLAFLTSYKSTTIRDILINRKMRGGETKFTHSAIDLDGAVASALQERSLEGWTDPRAVILQTSRKDWQSTLNLAPLVFDENAFAGYALPKLFFFAYHVDAAHAAYSLIGRPEVQIILPDDTRDDLQVIADTFAAFKAATFA